MKSTFKIILGLFVGVFAFIGCSDSDDNTNLSYPLFSLSKDNITMGAEGGKESFVVQAMGGWSVVSAPDWLSVSPANGVGMATCEVSVQSTPQFILRSGNIRVRSGAMESIISVEQLGYDKAIVPKKEEIEIESLGKRGERFFEVDVVTNVNFDVNVAYDGADEGWVVLDADNKIEPSQSARPRTVKLRFEWSANVEPEERIARIQFVPTADEDKSAVTKEIVVLQKPSVKIEDSRAGDSIAMILAYELLGCDSEIWDTSERMNNWDGVTLWEVNDKDLPCDEAVGRVRSVLYRFFDTEESIPEQISHLKYLESFTLFSNNNAFLKNVELGSEICDLKYLKELVFFSCGIVTLSEDFVKLGETLEVLDLNANNIEEVPSFLNKENFPHLRVLDLGGMRRRSSVKDLTKKDEYPDGIGLNIKSGATGPSQLRNLFLWDNLEYLGFSVSYLEGQLPDFEVGKDGVVAYTQADVDAFGGDTIQWLADNNIPKILPKIKTLRLNLNFFTGDLPDWLLYHPNFMEWIPQSLVFPQEEGVDSEGNKPGFDNEPTDFEYYYAAFPLMRAKYEIKEEIEEED